MRCFDWCRLIFCIFSFSNKMLKEIEILFHRIIIHGLRNEGKESGSYLLHSRSERIRIRTCNDLTGGFMFHFCSRSCTQVRYNQGVLLFIPRRLLRSSRPQEICQPPQRGFFCVHTVHALLQFLGNIFQLFTHHLTSTHLTPDLRTI